MSLTSPIDYDTIRERFSGAENLPELPTAAVRLCELIDQGTATTAVLERVILGDPALTAALLRQASSAYFGGSSRGASTVRGAIMLLGERAIRSLAVSLWVQSLMDDATGKSTFDVQRYARHSAFVGFTARYLLSCRQRRGAPSGAWSPDEVFAAGLLHDLGVGLLAVTYPELYDQTSLEAGMRGWCLERAFRAQTGGSLVALGAIAARAWKLPDLFALIPEQMMTPLEAGEDTPILCAVRYADWLALHNGFGLESFELELTPLDEGVFEALGMLPEEVESLVDLIAGHVDAYTQVAA